MSGVEPEKSRDDLSLAGFRRLMDSPATVIVPTLNALQQGQRQRLKQLQQEQQREKDRKFMALVEAIERTNARRRSSTQPRENQRGVNLQSAAGSEPMTGNTRGPRGSEHERDRPNDPWNRARRDR
jgi:hypothetical protein